MEYLKDYVSPLKLKVGMDICNQLHEFWILRYEILSDNVPWYKEVSWLVNSIDRNL